MEHRRIARLLQIAGGIALLGLLFAFFIWKAPVVGEEENSAAPGWLALMYKAVAALPYLLALFHYFSICENIGRNRSFSIENVNALGRIARCLWGASALWALGLALLAFGIAPVQTRPVSLARTLLALVMAATLAVSLVAWAMERLLARAVRLQEENELTI